MIKFYIGTVYILTSMIETIEGDAGISRRVIRLKANSPEFFKAQIRDFYIHDVDVIVDFGPISLSKHQ